MKTKTIFAVAPSGVAVAHATGGFFEVHPNGTVRVVSDTRSSLQERVTAAEIAYRATKA